MPLRQNNKNNDKNNKNEIDTVHKLRFEEITNKSWFFSGFKAIVKLISFKHIRANFISNKWVSDSNNNLHTIARGSKINIPWHLPTDKKRALETVEEQFNTQNIRKWVKPVGFSLMN